MKRFCKFSLMWGVNFKNTTHQVGTWRATLKTAGLACILAMTALTACNNDEVDGISVPNNQLQLKFGVNNPTSRAIFTESTLPNAKPVGVKLDDGDETAYDKYTNITFTGSDDDKGQQVWTPSEAVVLGPTKATLYAYYPWTSGVSIDVIPVDMTAEDQTDWLYATPVENVDEDNASHAVTMNHALANINLTINRGSYVGDGNISSITVQSDAFATKGTFNAAQPEPAFTSFADTEGQPLTRSITATLGSTADIMVVPTATEDNIDFIINVDGVNYTAQAKPVQLVNGKSYLYTLTLNSTFLGVSAFGVQPWVTQQKDDDLILEKEEPGGYTANNTTDVVATYLVDEPSTYSRAAGMETQVLSDDFDLSTIEKMYVNGVEVTPAKVISFTEAGEQVVVFTLKDISVLPGNMFKNLTSVANLTIPEECTAVGAEAFNGCANLSRIVSFPTTAPEILTTMSRSLDGPGGSVATVEGVRYAGVLIIPKGSRSSYGTWVSDRSEGGSYFDVNYWRCVEEGTFTYEDGFYYSEDGTHLMAWEKLPADGILRIKEGVTMIEYCAFWNCTQLKNIEWPSNSIVVDDGAFSYCTGITGELVIPGHVNAFGQYTFRGCTGITNFKLMEGVKTIGTLSMEGCTGLTELVLPSTIENIMDNAFNQCTNLKKLTCLATTAPYVTKWTFFGLQNPGTLYVPAGCKDAYSKWMQTGDYYLGKYGWSISELTE